MYGVHVQSCSTDFHAQLRGRGQLPVVTRASQAGSASSLHVLRRGIHSAAANLGSSLRIRCTPDFENLAVALRIWVDKDLEMKGVRLGLIMLTPLYLWKTTRNRRRFVSHSIELQA